MIFNGIFRKIMEKLYFAVIWSVYEIIVLPCIAFLVVNKIT